MMFPFSSLIIFGLSFRGDVAVGAVAAVAAVAAVFAVAAIVAVSAFFAHATVFAVDAKAITPVFVSSHFVSLF